MKKLIRFVALFLLVAAFIVPIHTKAAKKIKTHDKQLVIIKGTKYTPKVSGGNGSFTFKSSNPSIAYVNKNTGLIRARKTGQCRYIITSGSQRVTLPIIVRVNLLRSQTNFIAHRGEMNKAPEDTIAAFREAYKEGYKMYECDCRRTDSGAYIIYHDEDAWRLGLSRNKLVNSFLTYENLKNYPIKRMTYGVKNEKIPTLRAALTFAKKHKMRMFIHMKPDVDWNENDVINIQKIIAQTGMSGNAYPFCARPNIVAYLSKHLKHYGYVTGAYDEATLKRVYKNIKPYHPDYIWFRYNDKTLPGKDLIKAIQKQGMDVGSYPVRSKTQAAKVINIGLDYCICDHLYFKKK